MLSTITKHPEFTLMQPEVTKIRDCVRGAFFVKAKTTDYLPHPSSLDTTSKSANMRYQQYIAGAEFDEIPSQTLKSLVGKMELETAEIEAPERLSYLLEDADGDGMSIDAMMSQTAQNILPAKWHALVADYQGLSDLPTEGVSIADLKALKPRATIKQYNRDSVVYWHFERINGKMQLSYICFYEQGLIFNQAAMAQKTIDSYLILALDEEGNYYQQKIVSGADGGLQEGGRSYVQVSGAPLKWLPVQIVSDESIQAGSMPQEMGYLSGIVDLTLARYQVSAEYKEAMRMLPPTTNFYGVSDLDWEAFQKVNGRDYVAVGAGAVNIFGKEASAELLSANISLEGYERYFKDNEAKLRALGAVFPADLSGNRTATEVQTYSEEQSSRLVGLANQLENAFTRILQYCGMFEGLWAQDMVEQNDQVTIVLKKDFSQSRISAQDVQQIRENYLSGLIDRQEAVDQLAQGGWTVSTAEDLLNRSDGGDLTQ